MDNRVFVPVRVNEGGPFSFLLDTGSFGETVNVRLATSLHLPRTGHGTTDGAGEKKEAYSSVHIDSLELGQMNLGGMDLPALDTSGLERAIGFTHFDGVLGSDLFQRAVVTLDLARNQIVLNDPRSYRPGIGFIRVPFALNEDKMPIITAEFNGQRARFLVDTGDRSSLTLFGPFWKKYGFDGDVSPTVIAMTGFGIGGPIRSLVGRPKTFSIGAIKILPPVTRLSLQKAGVFTSADYAGSIGMGVLKRFVCVFDYSRHNLWLQKAENFNYADRYDRSGTWLGLDDKNRVVLMDVVQDGPAAQAGARPGDVVLGIDHHAANAETLPGLRDLLKVPKILGANFDLQRHGSSFNVRLRLTDLIAPASSG